MKESYECSFNINPERTIEKGLQTRPYLKSNPSGMTTYETFSTTLPDTRIKISLDYSSKKGRIDIISKDEGVTKKDIREKIIEKELHNIL